MRIYIYEAYIVVISAAIFGTIVGFITAAAVAIQFYSIIEMPIDIDFPWNLLALMMGLSMVTIMFAVCTPVTQVNNNKTLACSREVHELALIPLK